MKINQAKEKGTALTKTLITISIILNILMFLFIILGSARRIELKTKIEGLERLVKQLSAPQKTRQTRSQYKNKQQQNHNNSRVLTIQDKIAIANIEKAKWAIKGMKIGGKPIDTKSYDKEIARIKRYGVKGGNWKDHHNYRRKPLEDCIKPNSVVDKEVNECMKGHIKKSW